MQNLLWIPGFYLLILFGKIQISGKHNLAPLREKLIFTSNHASELDGILVLSTFFPFSRFMPMMFVSREQSFYKPTFFKRILFLGNGTVFRALGAYPAIVGLKDYSKSLTVHTEYLKQGGRVCIFPEGKIKSPGEKAEAKGGVGYLVYETDATVVPYRISGAEYLNWKSFFSRSHNIQVDILPPVRAQDLKSGLDGASPENFKFIAQKILSIIHEYKD